jgi:hypothetical protein
MASPFCSFPGIGGVGPFEFFCRAIAVQKLFEVIDQEGHFAYGQI